MLRITNLPMTYNTVHGQIHTLSINKLYQHASIINHYSNKAKPLCNWTAKKLHLGRLSRPSRVRI